jgi:zinc finger FYVE domain-containing protein 26
MFNMEKSTIAKEAKFAEQYELALKRLRSEDISPGHHQMAVLGHKSHGVSRHSMATSSLSVIANVAAAGISSMSVSNTVDQILGLSNLPVFLVESTKPQQSKTAVNKLCEIFLDPSNMAATIILDLACTATSSWEKSKSLINMADKRLSVHCKSDINTLSVLTGSDSTHKLHLSFRPIAHFGYGKFLHRLCASISLATHASGSFLPYYCRGLPDVLTTASLPLDSFDLQRYSDGMVAIKKELKHVTKITKEHGIWPYRGSVQSKQNSRDSSSVLTAVKSLLATVQRTVPAGGWIEQLLHR